MNRKGAGGPVFFYQAYNSGGHTFALIKVLYLTFIFRCIN